jgi:hypothetical protein
MPAAPSARPVEVPAAAARPAAPAPAAAEPTAAPATDQAGTVVTDALALSEFFLDRGDYDSAIGELEAALARVPGDQRLRAALEKARKAKAAEAAVVGAGG